MQFSISEIEERIFRFNINETNQNIFLELINLPYDIYKPVIDLLISEEITPEDLQDKLETVSSSLTKARYASSANKAAEAYLDETLIKNEILRLVSGEPPIFMPVIFDNSEYGLEEGDKNSIGKLQYGVFSAEYNKNYPNSLQKKNSSSLIEAKKKQQQAFIAARGNKNE
jgi:hypothetical protein